MLSLRSYCDAFQIDLCWLIHLADEVVAQRLTAEQASEILLRWPQVKNLFKTAAGIAIDEALQDLCV